MQDENAFTVGLIIIWKYEAQRIKVNCLLRGKIHDPSQHSFDFFSAPSFSIKREIIYMIKRLSALLTCSQGRLMDVIPQCQKQRFPSSSVDHGILAHICLPSITLGSIVIVLASHFRPPPDMSEYLLNPIKNIRLISPMHIIHKILWGMFTSSRIQHHGDKVSTLQGAKWILRGLCAKPHQRRRRPCLTGNSNYYAYYCGGSLKSSSPGDAKPHTRHDYCAGGTESSLGRFSSLSQCYFFILLRTKWITVAAPASRPWNGLALIGGND